MLYGRHIRHGYDKCLTIEKQLSTKVGLNRKDALQKIHLVDSWVLESSNVVAEAMVISMDKPLEWAVGFFFGNTELSLELWTVIAGISGFDD